MGRGVGRIAAAALAAVCLLVAAAPGAQAVSPDWRQRMLQKVNSIRAEAGAPPVRLCGALNRSAKGYAGQMASTATFGHDGPDGRGPQQRMADAGYRGAVYGENIAAGQATVVRVVRQWRASPSHLATMTDPRFRHVGFGYAATSRLEYPTYWVQHYGVGGRC